MSCHWRDADEKVPVGCLHNPNLAVRGGWYVMYCRLCGQVLKRLWSAEGETDD